MQKLELPTDVPLTSNGIPIRNLWYMLSYSWNDLQLLTRWKGDVESAPTIDGLLSRILLNLVTQRVRIGLGRNYRNKNETLNGIRGRVDFATSLKRLAFQNAQAHCRFQNFDSNVPKNQIVRSTLNYVAANGDFGPGKIGYRLRNEIRHLVRQLAHIDFIEVRPSVVKRQQLERDDQDYRLMLTLCYLILSQQMPTEEEGVNHSQAVERNWKYVWQLFESFVANFYHFHLADWSVKSQKQMKWPTEGSSSFLPVMKPDLLLYHKPSTTRVILDTKLTQKCLTKGQYGNLTFAQSHVYQLYAYLRSQESEFGKMTGVLLYPAAHYDLCESVSMHGHAMQWRTIDLANDWLQVEKDLLKLMESLVHPCNSPPVLVCDQHD